MAISRENIHASLIKLIDRMEQLAGSDSRLSGFGQSTLRNVFLNLRKEAMRREPDQALVGESLQTWTTITGDEFLAARLLREFRHLSTLD